MKEQQDKYNAHLSSQVESIKLTRKLAEPELPSRGFQPCDDAVLIRLEKPERLTASKRIWIPDTAKRENWELYQGTVIAVGPGMWRKTDGRRNAPEIAVGDRVLFYWMAGEAAEARWDEDGEEYWVLSEKSIQAVTG